MGFVTLRELQLHCCLWPLWDVGDLEDLLEYSRRRSTRFLASVQFVEQHFETDDEELGRQGVALRPSAATVG